MRPIYGCHENFRDFLTTPTAIFHPKILYAYHADYSYMCTRFPAIFDLSFGVSNLQCRDRRGSGMVPSKRALVNSYSPSMHIIPLSASARNFRSQFSVGVENPQPQLWEGGLGAGMVPFKRALVSSYKVSIVTFPLSLRVLEILQLLFSIPRTPLPPKFPNVPRGVGGSPFRHKERRCWANSLCN